jgi:quercetin dioxygenase-like cupin family protein
MKPSLKSALRRKVDGAPKSTTKQPSKQAASRRPSLGTRTSAEHDVAQGAEHELARDIASVLPSVLSQLSPAEENKLTPSRRAAINARVMQDIAAPTFVADALNVASARWHKAAPGIEVLTLFESANSRARLVRLMPGGCIPGHRHVVDEAAWIVQGSCTVGKTKLQAGDYYMVPAGAAHDDIVSVGRNGCVLLIHGPGFALRSAGAAARGAVGV